jgi:hypothetical protein
MPDDVRATAVRARSFINSHPSLVNLLHREGIRIFDLHKSQDRTIQELRLTPPDNMIVWGIKVPEEWWEENFPEANILFVENGMLDQKYGAMCSLGGRYSSSHVINEMLSGRIPEPWAMKAVPEFTKEHFGWDFLQGGDPSGPVLIVHQNDGDASVRYHFDLRKYGDPSPTHALIRVCEEHLPPDRPVIFRPHPLARSRFRRRLRKGQIPLPDHWELNLDGSVYDILPGCSSMVTINSTVASEALTLGIPIVTLGSNCYSFCGMVHEIGAEGLEILRGIDHLRPPGEHEVLRYCGIVLESTVPHGAEESELCRIRPLTRWIRRAKGVWYSS